MSQLAHIAQTLNALADERHTTPDDVLKAATARGDPFERTVEELDAHKKRAVADAHERADVVAAAHRLMVATDARAAAFHASLVDVVDARCRAVEAEYDARIKAKQAEYDVLIAAKAGEVEVLRKEKAGKVEELRSLIDGGEFGALDKSDFVFMARCTRQLKAWTGKTHGTVIYDSTADPFTADGLFEKVRGKPNIALVGFTTDGDVFGGFYGVAVTKQDEWFNDPTSFVFSFESHGRCATPQKFVVREGLRRHLGVYFWKNDNRGFVGFWVDGSYGFFLGNESSRSYCYRTSQGLEGLEDTTLTGKNSPNHFNGPYHHCTRLVAVQLS